MKINASMLREKFVIDEIQHEETDKLLKIVAPSTRMPLRLQSGDGIAEEFVIRTNNMHSCAKMAGQIVKSFEKGGPLFHRFNERDWYELWDESLNSFDRKYNPERWVCVYYNGKPAFLHGQHHSFFDVIEKCDIVDKTGYENSIKTAQQAFGAAGKDVNIEYDSNVALVTDIDRMQGRCGMILRGPKHTTTFNFYVTPKGSTPINVAQCLSAAAAFLEGSQRCFIIGTAKAKLQKHIIEQYSEEYLQMKEAVRRIQSIETEISVLENVYNLRYRPEKPIFHNITNEAETAFKESLETQ